MRIPHYTKNGIFPPKESEDERMLREFNDYLCVEIECRTNDIRDEKDSRTLNMLCYVLKKVDAWLEKQKEPTTEELYAEAGTTEKEYIANTMKVVRAMREKQKEQKPADDNPLDDPRFTEGFDAGRTVQKIFDEPKPDCDGCAKHLEGYLNGRVDAENKLLEGYGILWMPDGELHIKPRWKPSEEQMEAFKGYIEDFQARAEAAVGGWNNFDVMIRLYEQLKKL